MKLKTLECDYCNGSFELSSVLCAGRKYQKRKSGVGIYCSTDCRIRSRGRLPIASVSCAQCGKDVDRLHSQQSKTKNSFCNNSCAATYNNAHKTKGTRRSKLETWLESELSKLYSFEIHYNQRDAINSELDIYIPSLRLAFELNGIFHYEPIYSKETLSRIQVNDSRKFQACIERGIELCIIDTSAQGYFKPATSQKYLDIIQSVINQNSAKLVLPDGFEPTLDTSLMYCHLPIGLREHI